MSGNYEYISSRKIITGNYQLVYIITRKCGNYRDTGVSKNIRHYDVDILKKCKEDWTYNKQYIVEKMIFKF